MTRDQICNGLQEISDEAYSRWVHHQYTRDKLIIGIGTYVEEAIKLLKEQESTIDGWISVKGRLPEEHPSIFAPFYGTERWNSAMWRNESDRVLVTIQFPDGTRTVDKGKLQDGIWKTGVSPMLPQEVTHWAVWPEPPKEEEYRNE